MEDPQRVGAGAAVGCAGGTSSGQDQGDEPMATTADTRASAQRWVTTATAASGKEAASRYGAAACSPATHLVPVQPASSVTSSRAARARNNHPASLEHAGHRHGAAGVDTVGECGT